MKHTQIDKVGKENRYTLYEDGRVVGEKISFTTLAAAPELLEACQRALNSLSFQDEPSLVLETILREVIAKAEGRD